VIGLYVYGWFESLALVLLCLALLGRQWQTYKTALAASTQFIVILIARNLPLAFGSHTILGIIFLALAISLLFSVSYGKGLVAAAIAMAILIAFDTLTVLTLKTLANLNINLSIWAFSRVPNILFLLITTAVVRARRTCFFP